MGPVPEFLIITGMSGAGRSQAAATLEDLGWFVIDNLPTALVTKVAELVAAPDSTTDQVVLVVGRRAEQFDELAAAVGQLRSSGSKVRILFLEASDEVLVRRFEGTRRRHPFGTEGVTEAIALERRRLEPIRALADVVVDTTDLNVNQLRERLIDLFTADQAEPMQISLMSFGFQYGLPLDVDTVFDVRFLPNPHWIEELRPQSGLDAPVGSTSWNSRTRWRSSVGWTTCWGSCSRPTSRRESRTSRWLSAVPAVAIVRWPSSRSWSHGFGLVGMSPSCTTGI